jgi:putative oxygen-independent coproporphyrinogen III oxidase
VNGPVWLTEPASVSATTQSAKGRSELNGADPRAVGDSTLFSTPAPPELAQPETLGIYVHIPWCVRKCPYCDFNSHQTRGAIPEQAYLQALLADCERDLPYLNKRSIASLFIGGGTPSLMSPDAVGQLLSTLAARLDLTADAEITLEANPGTVERGRFHAFRQIGIKRLSLGVQSFNNGQLRALGRIHSAEEAVRAAEAAAAAGFEDINLDLMFGLPEQTSQAALADIRSAMQLEPTHISWYQLTIEPDTAYHRRPPRLPDDETAWAMQRDGEELLASHGYKRYEVSAYAQPDHQCRHNLNYWRFGDYLGIGAGAHSKITDPAYQQIVRFWKMKQPRAYMDTAGTDACTEALQCVPREDRAFEFLMNHLRIKDGFPIARFMARTGRPLICLEPALSECINDGLLERQGGTVRCTEFGWRFLDAILQRFLPSG